ncbi:hypothetical protein E2562_014771 [Oryza meyeriana var. granulata]|uniref:Uncharacterized protein n=1 Tax=Oryza meyeriana var. granulata TaxID=110450 RepID=A0A6G1BLD5_9ORYZ|nr:hypothetical protein E2562_014771 [Oryza meyeriana var. granulata]
MKKLRDACTSQQMDGQLEVVSLDPELSTFSLGDNGRLGAAAVEIWCGGPYADKGIVVVARRRVAHGFRRPAATARSTMVARGRWRGSGSPDLVVATGQEVVTSSQKLGMWWLALVGRALA